MVDTGRIPATFSCCNAVEERLSLRISALSRHRDRLQELNTELTLKLREAEARLTALALFDCDEVRAAVTKAERRIPFVDLEHILGVLCEEFREFADEVHVNHGPRARLELLDIAGAAVKGWKQKELGG